MRKFPPEAPNVSDELVLSEVASDRGRGRSSSSAEEASSCILSGNSRLNPLSLYKIELPVVVQLFKLSASEVRFSDPSTVNSS